MENYRSDSFAAQEGYPSLDFTLLDRPSSSIVSAPGSTAPLFPGENPLSSFDFVDGSGVEQHGDRSFPGHRSYMPESAKDALRRNVSMHPGLLQRQGLGEHYLFGQDNQQSYSRMGNGEGHVQSQSVSLGAPNAEQLGAGNMPIEYTLGGNSKMPNGNKGSLSSSGIYFDDRRNLVASTQQYSSNSQNSSLNLSNFMLGTPDRLSNFSDNASESGLQYQQGQSHRYASQNTVGTTASVTMDRTFPTSQVPIWPATVPSEARAGGPTRGFGMTELQLLRQQALQSKQQQALLFKQQQAMRLQQQEAMRAQQEVVAKQQQKMQEEAEMVARKQEVLRMQQHQEATRLQQQEVMHSQQQEELRMQQHAMYMQQQASARTENQNAERWSQEQVGLPSKRQTTGMFQQQQAISSQQQKAIWGQQVSAEQAKNCESQHRWAWLTQQQQTFPSHPQQASLSTQRQALHSQKGQTLQCQNPQVFQNHQRLPGSQQQHLERFQQQTLQNHQQQQAPQPQQKHVSCLQHLPLQSQQEFYEASQQVLSQEEFPGTSYSALLHRPDTPPSHTQSGGETLFCDLESNPEAFPLANTCTTMWPTYGSSSYQGLSRESSIGQNLMESQNMRPPFRPHDDHNCATAEGEQRQIPLSEYLIVGSRAASPVNRTFEFNKRGSGDAEVGGSGSIGSSDSGKHHVPANPLLQNSQFMGRQSVQLNGLSNGPIQMNLLSHSQQHFQGLQSSQQRSWECLVQKHSVSKPSFPEVCLPLSRDITTIERGTLERGFQENLSSIGTGRTSPCHDSQTLRSVHQDIASSYKEHPMLTSAVGKVARSFMDEEERHGSDSRSVIAPLPGQDIGSHSRCVSEANNDTWGNRLAQLATPVVQRPVSPSDNTSQATLNINKGTLLNMQVPLNTTARNTLSSHESVVWKENDISGQTSSCLPKSEGQSQGVWKQKVSFPRGLDSSCEPPDRHVQDSTCKQDFQSDKANINAQCNMQSASLISMSPREQDNAGQSMHEKQYLVHEGFFQQVHNSLGLNGECTQPNANTEAFSQGTSTSNSEMGQMFKLNMSVGLQGPVAKKFRISEQQIDPTPRSVSLAHFKQSQASSPLSPQHVKLGLGPANLPQNIEQVGNVSTFSSSEMNSSYLKNRGPSSNMEGKNFFAGRPQVGSGSPAGSRSVNNMLLQINATRSNSSSFSKESADSEALPPASITRDVEGSEFSQGIMSATGNPLFGVGTNAGYYEGESSSNLHSNLKPSADNCRQPPPQGKFSTVSQHVNMDAGSLRVLQNQQIINMALKQLGNKAQAANLAGLLTTLKTSLSEHSKNSGDQKALPGLGECDRLPSGTAQADGSAPSLIESSQMILGKPANSGPVLERCSPHLISASLSVSDEYNQNCRFKQEEGVEATTTGLLSGLQRQCEQPVLINGSKSHALQSGEQGARIAGLRTMLPIPSQVGVRGRDSNSQPATFARDQYIQQQKLAIEGLFPRQASKGVIGQTVSVSETTEAQSRPFETSPVRGYLGKVASGQGDGAFVETAMELEKSQQLKAELVSQSGLQSVGTLPSKQRHLPMQIAIDAVIASSSPCTDKVGDVGLANDFQSSCNLRLPPNYSNGQVLRSQKSKLENNIGEDGPQKSWPSQNPQPVAHANSLSTRQEDTDGVKVEDVGPGVNGHVAISNGLPPCQIFPSKTSLPGPSGIHPKKRKKPVPLLIPWYIAATQPRDSLPSTSEMEIMWANTANRLSDKDDGDTRKENASSSMEARRRLRRTTQLMQQLIPPLSADLMLGNTPVNNECATFSLAKFALEDACRLVTNTRREATSTHDCSENKNMPSRGQGRTWGVAKSVAVTRCVESFMERARGLESELARIETSSSLSDLRQDIGDTAKLDIVNRLAKHHGASFTVEDSSESSSVDNISDVNAGICKSSSPKKYVTKAPMPRALPGVKCLSL